MLENDNLLAFNIKNKIESDFINAKINIIYDKEQNEYFISTRDKDLYYSESYGLLILDIKQNILWKQGKYNFYFILDAQEQEFDKLSKKITFTLKNEIDYKPWNVKKTLIIVDKHIDTENFSLVA